MFLHLRRNKLGKDLNNVEFRSEKMLLQLFTALASTREFIMRRQAILKAEKDINTHLSKNKTFLKFKYKLENE
ncbi:hypothetical protein G9O61_00g019460, partial [Vairimorpha ceranae]